MPTVDIFIKTTAQLNELQRTAAELTKGKKSADEMWAALAAMDKAEQDLLRTQRVFGDQSEQMASHLAELTRETKAAGVEADKTTSAKSRLFDGLKKLGNQVPIVGAVLGALKNPFTLIGVAALIAKNAIDQYAEAVAKMAESVAGSEASQGRILRFFEIVAEGKADAKAFEEQIAAIGKQGQTAAEWLKKMNDEIERKSQLEEAAAQKSGMDTPEAAAARAGNKRNQQATALFNAALKAEAAAEAAKAQLPGARADLQAAKVAVKEAEFRLGPQDQDAAARREFLLEQNKEIRGKIGVNPLLRSKLTADPPYTFRSEADLKELLASNQQELTSLDIGVSMRQADRVKARAAFDAARVRESRFEDTFRSNTEAARDFRRQSQAVADLGAVSVANDGIIREPGAGRGSAQFRYDAQRGALRDRNVQSGAREIGNEIKELVQEFKTIVSQLRTEIRRQQSSE